ncbi:hypothetical protein ANO14919_059440 [Xylariales sp. No.14919]|nr:hypothetical protein ANO14919_059440 [Xylariales sp. No.14919]
MSINSSNTLGFLEAPSPNHYALDWGASLPSLGRLNTFDTEPSLEINLRAEEQNFTAARPAASADYFRQSEDYTSSQLYPDSTSQATDFDHLTTISGISQSHSMPAYPSHAMQDAYRRKKSLRKSYRARRRSDGWSERLATAVSPSCTSQGPMASFNNHLITESLLQIYHDVLENNLACWLAKDTCPYKMQPRRPQLPPYSGASVLMRGGGPDTTELGPTWTNSMYRRVKLLDRVAQSTGLIRLTYNENQATSKALNLVIMAFATQWAQGQRRREKMFSTSQDTVDSARLEDVADDFVDEFEQCFQNSLWEQAKRALEDVSSVESYRVVYAELIFGLIQRPWAADDYSRTGIPESSKSNSLRDMRTSMPQIMEIISQDGPPVYTERASRKIKVLRYHLEAKEAGFLRQNYAYSSQHQEDALSKMTVEDRVTIGQLYWLAVMFDTVSSSMNERPVALTDEDCQHDAADTSSVTTDQQRNYYWNLELFAQDNPANPSTLSWPCPYDSSVQAVTRSAAVKVLLFRHVSYLQNALRKQQRGHRIEEIIQKTIQIYRYWNVTHGAFFRSLIKNYDSVPSRIKSWFPCIHIPWHLGALMLADLIEFVDQNGLGSEAASLERLNVNLAGRIRKSSATELSDLARVTTPQEIDSMPTEQLPGYHFAVNEGSILTEPWTVLLIRAFTKASIYHLGVAEDLRRQEWAILGQESDEYKEGLGRCDTCIKALWFLGRKSEMARSIGKILARLLQNQQAEHAPEEGFSQHSV